MIKRELESKLREWSQQYPVVTVTGPRQSGKTTLCRAVFADKPYVSMENIDNREFANSDFPYFYRDNNGCEVDLLFERGAALDLYEIKSSMTISNGFFSNMQKLERYTGRVHRKTLIYAGNEKSNRNDVQILPWKQISGVFDA